MLDRRRALATGLMATGAGAMLTPAAALAAVPAENGAQPSAFYRLRVGGFEVIRVHDGVAVRPLDAGFVRNAGLAEVPRLHPPEDVQARLGAIVRATVRRGGSVLLPSFAVGRAQALLWVLQRLRDTGEIPQDLPIYLDSPMATLATTLYQRHAKLLRIKPREAARLCEDVRLVGKAAESEKLTRSRWPSVIISASGMATGGRVLHHLKAMAPQARHHIVFPGFQVGGTRGAKLVEGARDVKIFGEYVAVKAEVSHLEGFSGHADADELMQWLRGFEAAPAQTFVVHGEPHAADALRTRIQDELGWRVRVPAHLELATL